MAKIEKQDPKKDIKKISSKKKLTAVLKGYDGVLSGVLELLDAARRASARAVNSIMTATYWEIGRRIVEFEQGGEKRTKYGEELLIQLAEDLSSHFGRGFSRFNLGRFRMFYLTFSPEQIRATASLKLPSVATNQIPAGKSPAFLLENLAGAFPLPWSHYVLLMSSSRSPEALSFYHTEALRGG